MCLSYTRWHSVVTSWTHACIDLQCVKVEELTQCCWIFRCLLYLRRKSQQTHRAALGPSTLSSEDEDGFYDTNITSILNESHLQTTNC